MEPRSRGARGGVAEIVRHPLLEPGHGIRVSEHAVGLGDDGVGIARVQPFARRKVAVRVDQRFGVGRSGDHERAVSGEPVVDHRRDVDDRDVGGGELPAEVGPVIEDVMGCRIRGVRGSECSDDAPIRRPILGVHDTRTRMRPVDHAMAPRRQERADEPLAVRGDRTVMGGGTIALPRGRVQHDGAIIRCIRQGSGVVICLRATDLDRAGVEIVIPQHATQSFSGRGSGDERVVVRFVLVRGHVHLVGLAVVDEHMPPSSVAEHLEVAHVLVHVEHHADVLSGDEALQLPHRRHECHGGRVLGQERPRTGRIAAQHDDRPCLRELGERPVPLAHLVHVHRPVGEVDSDAIVLKPMCGLVGDDAPDLGDRRAVRDCLAQQCHRLLRVRDQIHSLRIPTGPHDMIVGCMSTSPDARMRRSSPRGPGSAS